MCGRYTQTKNEMELAYQFGVPIPQFKIAPSYNIAPSQIAPVILNITSPELRMLRWGLIPFWAKDPAIGNKMINARAETLKEKPSFKKALQSKRCLVPADGFFEWVRKGKEKQPIRFILEHEPLFAFAGLWDEWKTPTGEVLNTFTIITVPANKTVEPIHNRMPVILDESNWKEWIDRREPIDKVCAWLKPYSGKKMVGFR